MWSQRNGKVILNINKIRDDFKIVSDNGLHLIFPKKNLWDWNRDELWLRSIIVNDDGEVVSCSWKKFGNYKEFEFDTEIFEKELKSGSTIRHSNKEDGTLCIRSIINDKLVLRTRGTMYGDSTMDNKEPFNKRFMKVMVEKYPKMLDTSIEPDKSLLFEYISPDNMIVVKYKEADLIFLGYVSHNDLHIGTWEEIEEVAQRYGLNLVNLHQLSTRSPIKIVETINEWNTEGIVVRCCNDQVFVKIKSAQYLANHKLKYSMNYEMILEFIWNYDIKNEEGFVDLLKRCGWDWELIESAKEYYVRYEKAYKLKITLLDKARDIVMNFNIQNPENNFVDEKARRKCLAQMIFSVDMDFAKFIRPMVFALYEKRMDKVDSICRKIIIGEGE
jgi:hypothetical protein